MYISFIDYSTLGGHVTDEAAFASLEVRARRLVDRRTQNRLVDTDYDDVPEEVKLCMANLIDELDAQIALGTDAVSSFSNDGVSVSYVDAKSNDRRLYDILETVLPDDLLYRGID